MLGLEPIGEHLMVDPALPDGHGRLELLDIPGRWGRSTPSGAAASRCATGRGRARRAQPAPESGHRGPERQGRATRRP